MQNVNMRKTNEKTINKINLPLINFSFVGSCTGK